MKKIILTDLDLGDKRLDTRCHQIVNQLADSPGVSIPQFCSNTKDTKATYRFFANDKVDSEKIMETGYQETRERIESNLDKILLAVQDTTDLDFTKQPHLASELGYLQQPYCHGFKMHSCLAVSGIGLPLGLLWRKIWSRDQKEYGKRKDRNKKLMSEKESYRWVETAKKIENLVTSYRRVIVIGDRESDIYEFFNNPRPDNLHLLVRAAQNRRLVSSSNKLFETINLSPIMGYLTLKLNRTPKRKPRKVKLKIRYQPVTLSSPDQNQKGSCSIWGLSAKELNPPKSEPAVHWLLLTTLPINSLDDATTILRWYSYRWLIERYHYVLKSGCKFEELQLESKDRLTRALSVYCLVAWRILQLTYQARLKPNDSCQTILSSNEWQVLWMMVNKTKKLPLKPPSISQAINLIARLGGFLNRINDGPPGTKTIWMGLRRLSDMVETWRFFNENR